MLIPYWCFSCEPKMKFQDFWKNTYMHRLPQDIRNELIKYSGHLQAALMYMAFHEQAESSDQSERYLRHHRTVNWAIFNPQKTLLVSSDRGGMLYFWDFSQESPTFIKEFSYPHIYSEKMPQFNNEGTHMLLQSLDNSVHLYNLADDTINTLPQLHCPEQIAYDATNKYLVTLYASAAVLKIFTGGAMKEFRFSVWLQKMVMHPKLAQIVFVIGSIDNGHNRELVLYDLNENKFLQHYKKNNSETRFNLVVFDPTGSFLAYTSESNKNIRLIDLQDIKLEKEPLQFSADHRPVSICFDSTGSLLLAHTPTSQNVWNVHTKHLIFTHDDLSPACSVSFCYDNTHCLLNKMAYSLVLKKCTPKKRDDYNATFNFEQALLFYSSLTNYKNIYERFWTKNYWNYVTETLPETTRRAYQALQRKNANQHADS